MDMLKIENATVVTPAAVLPQTNVWIAEGRVLSIGDPEDSPAPSRILDAAGDYLMPGFIDLHVHGGGGADFMDATPEAFETAVRAHLAHGTTLLYPTAMAARHASLCAFLDAYQAFRATSPLAALTPGVHLEGPYFYGASKDSRGAQDASVLRLPDPEEVEILLARAKGSILRWDASPELEGAQAFAKRMVEAGILCSAAHTDATAAQAKAGFDAGFSHVTHFYNVVSSHRKREQTVYAGVVEATYLDDDVTVELIGDGCHIPREDVYLALKIKGAEKVSVITDGIRLSGTDLTHGKLGSLTEGTEVMVEDGVAKLLDRSFFAGSIATMDRCLRVLCADYGLELSTASILLSLAPALRMGVADRKGSIAPGKDADLLLIRPDLSLRAVLVGGEVVSPKKG